MEGDLETVEPYQFEPIASDLSAESDTEAEDDDSRDEDSAAETSRNMYMYALLKKLILACSKKFTSIHYCRCPCRNCAIMLTSHECICCCEVERVVVKRVLDCYQTAVAQNYDAVK